MIKQGKKLWMILMSAIFFFMIITDRNSVSATVEEWYPPVYISAETVVVNSETVYESETELIQAMKNDIKKHTPYYCYIYYMSEELFREYVDRYKDSESYYTNLYYSEILDQGTDQMDSAVDCGDYMREEAVWYGHGITVEFGKGWREYKTMEQHHDDNRFCAVMNVMYNYTTTEAQEIQLSTDITNLCTNGELSAYKNASDFEKIKATVEWVHNHVAYSLLGNEDGYYLTAHSAFYEGLSDCRGYALLTYRILREFGIGTRIVYAEDPKTYFTHLWNIVYLNGKWYSCDSQSGAVLKGSNSIAVCNVLTYENAGYDSIIKNVSQEDYDPDAPLEGWVAESGVRYWYEDGVKQGLTGRGKEIYDPSSDAWYWLDAVDGGKMATSKDVYQESLAGQWGDYIGADGKRYGKWVRYDENGRMVKGWQDTANGRYFFDDTYGTMAKGFATIDGVEYYFDTATGILQYTVGEVPQMGWKTIDGKQYWYENSIRQGYSVDASYRGKEIYDPGTNAWYWLDNIQGGAMATSKDVYQESLAGDWGESYNASGEKIGKWVRYDADGQMIKGWSGDYYFDEIYGTMAKGNVVIEGNTYYFDEVTGVLQ